MARQAVCDMRYAWQKLRRRRTKTQSDTRRASHSFATIRENALSAVRGYAKTPAPLPGLRGIPAPGHRIAHNRGTHHKGKEQRGRREHARGPARRAHRRRRGRRRVPRRAPLRHAPAPRRACRYAGSPQRRDAAACAVRTGLPVGKRPHRAGGRRAHLPGHRHLLGAPGGRRGAAHPRQHPLGRQRRRGARLHRRPPAHERRGRRAARPHQHRRQHAGLRGNRPRCTCCSKAAARTTQAAWSCSRPAPAGRA